MKESIHIYFTSDLHSYFQSWPYTMQSISQKINQHEEDGEFYLLLDNGDHMDRVHPITEASLGQANVSLLNAANYHAVTLGNNEGITLPEDELYHLYDEATFDVVCANLQAASRKNPNWLAPYKIYETKHQTRIAVIGLTAPFQLFYEKLNWTALNPFDVLDDLIPDLESKADVIIVLSHLGINDDEAIARNYNVDAIIGGHTHHLLEKSKTVNGSTIHAAGKNGLYYGEVFIEYDHKTKELVTNHGSALLNASTPHKQTSELLNQLEIEANDKLNQAVANLQGDLPINWYEETTLMKSFVQTLKEWTGAEAAMLNSGVLLEGFKKGMVTKKAVHQSCPHPMNPCTMILTGKELLEAIRMLESDHYINFELKGLGFRGKKIGKMIYDDIELHYHEDSNYVEQIYLKGEAVEAQRYYKIATADTFSFSWLLPPISTVKEKHYYMPEFLRDVLEVCLANIGRN
ncbi:bifunctional metallophosphatase/5'-nucleotidase [Halalkalibacillus halophilus]|uniref:bifunctional metallophosphatase/5'-nucleotidase n=1 Tax=Halalkalibacillus halophilus TaxID=392827 RepID=UPI0004046D47|nr:bifunctional UDP-sugar hydrolase/5'-nucleotidase [Halalkalibacillus halophilus]